MVSRSTDAQRKFGSICSGADLTVALSQRNKETEKTESPELSLFQQIRDIFESLVVALFLAFLFKTFEAEAFVIPTGSMAPTLMGRHKDVECEECHYWFQTSASEEVDSSTNQRNGRHVVAGTCPQCGYTQYFGDDVPQQKNDKRAPSYTGDRILVSKMAFDQREIQRFDVSVFRSPSEPRINFIKRIVGFPNENLRVQYGDLFVQKLSPTNNGGNETGSNRYTETHDGLAPDVNLAYTAFDNTEGENNFNRVEGHERFAIQRKEYRYLRQIMQVVYDADYIVPALEELGWPDRWTDDWENEGSGFCGWTKSAEPRKVTFTFNGKAEPVKESSSGNAPIGLSGIADISPVDREDKKCAWLRYRHIIPTSKEWFYLSEGRLPPEVSTTRIVMNNPRLIDDFSGYNAGISREAQSSIISGELEWSNSPEDEFARLSSRGSGGSERVFCAKNPDGFGCNWVGDLGLSCELSFLKTMSNDGRVLFDLVKGGVVFRCIVSPSQESITLEIPSIPDFLPVTTTYPFKLNKNYRFAFYNVDEEMRVVIDDKELCFQGVGGRYDHLTVSTDGTTNVSIPRNRDPNARDLAPIAIGAHDVALRVSHLKTLRDVYYIAAGRGLEPWDSSLFSDFGTLRCDRLGTKRVFLGNEEESARFMSTPALWQGYGNTKSAVLSQRENQYVAFGDNSGFSLDSRLWANSVVPHYVDRKYLIGKAFYVYWPHGLLIPVLGPYWPNLSKMRHID